MTGGRKCFLHTACHGSADSRRQAYTFMVEVSELCVAVIAAPLSRPPRPSRATPWPRSVASRARVTHAHGDAGLHSICVIHCGHMAWRVTTLNITVDRELDALPADQRARFVRIAGLIAAVGVERVGMPHVGHLTGPLWEMRRGGRDRIARALYGAAADREVVVVRAFARKTRRTRRREIELALRRTREVLP